MSRTFIQQDTQIYASQTYNDGLSSGSTLVSGAASLQDDLNGLRAQVRRILYSTSAGNWYDGLPFPVGASAKGISQIASDVYNVQNRKFLFRALLLTDITIPAAQNWVVLSAAGSQTPSETAAVDAGTANGAIVAQLANGALGSNVLTAITGANALSPKNLCLIADGSTGQPLKASSGSGINKDIYGLLQVQNGTTDGTTFNDSTNKVQISFVTANSTDDALIAAPVGDIAGKTINYVYVRRLDFTSLPEQAFLSGVFVDQSAASTDVTLGKAVSNQVGAVTQTDRDINWDVSNSYKFQFQNSTGSQTFWSLQPTSGGTTLATNVDTETHVTTNPATYTKGVQVSTGTTQLNLGVTAGQVDSAGALTLASASTFNTNLSSGNKITLSDTNKAASSYAGTLSLSDASSDWSNYVSAFGQVSLLNAIYQACNTSSRTKVVAVVTSASIPIDTNVTGAVGSPNLDAQLADYSARTFLTGVDVYLNGVLLRNGADSSTSNDVYPGTTQSTGDLKFKFSLRGGTKPDVLTMILP